MSSPRLTVDLRAIENNTRVLVQQLSARSIGVAGVTKSTLGSPGVAAAMLRGGATGLADSRVENLNRLSTDTRSEQVARADRMLIRTPALSQVDQVVRVAHRSLNASLPVLAALDAAAARAQVIHRVILMVELGDLREGVPPEQLTYLATATRALKHLRLDGIGANLACQNGIVPDDRNMGQLTRWIERLETRLGVQIPTVSGGNSASVQWAMTATDTGRVTELRLGEAILLGTEPSHRTPLPGLHTHACRLTAELIEVGVKPLRPWGTRAQTAEGLPSPDRAPGAGTRRQAIVALGRQDTNPDGLRPPAGITIVGMSSDHLLIDLGDHRLTVGDHVTFGLNYSSLVRAMTSPFIVQHEELSSAPAPC